MPKLHLTSNLKGEFIAPEKSTYKAKPKDIPMQVFISMVKDRDRIFYQEAKIKGDTKMMEFLINRYKK